MSCFAAQLLELNLAFVRAEAERQRLLALAGELSGDGSADSEQASSEAPISRVRARGTWQEQDEFGERETVRAPG
jgi:hypothetical protein